MMKWQKVSLKEKNLKALGRGLWVEMVLAALYLGRMAYKLPLVNSGGWGKNAPTLEDLLKQLLN